MARPREFERDEVVEKALSVFWRQGYRATSVQDLVVATGLNRGSLYDTFGDKHSLFLETVEHYCANVSARRLARLEKPGPLRRRIAGFFQGIIDFAQGEGRLLGCLMTNSTVELAPHNRDARLAVISNMAATEAAFRRVLTRAKKEGALGADKSPTDLARFFTVTADGLNVMAKAAPEPAALRSVVRVALQALD